MQKGKIIVILFLVLICVATARKEATGVRAVESRMMTGDTLNPKDQQEQIARIRQFLNQTPPPAEQQAHIESTLFALRMFAENKKLPCPLDRPTSAEKTSPFLLYQDTTKLCLAYQIKPDVTLSAEPNSLTGLEITAILSVAGQLLQASEKKMVEIYATEKMLPLQTELAQELNRSTLVYIDGSGTQRQAKTPRAQQLINLISDIESSIPFYHASINTLYRDARIALISKQKNLPRDRAERMVDLWISQQLKRISMAEAKNHSPSMTTTTDRPRRNR